MPNELILHPAYGRRYRTKAEMVAAWVEGKDFKIYNGPYCSVRDVATIREEYDWIVLRQIGVPAFEYEIKL